MLRPLRMEPLGEEEPGEDSQGVDAALAPAADAEPRAPETLLRLGVLFQHEGKWKSAEVDGFHDGAMVRGMTHEPTPGFLGAYRRAMELPLPDAKPFRPAAFKGTLQLGESPRDRTYRKDAKGLEDWLKAEAKKRGFEVK